MVEGLTYIEDLVSTKRQVQFFALQSLRRDESIAAFQPVAGWSSGSSSGS